MKYVYPATLYLETDGRYSVLFPDLKGCVTQGENLYDALTEAQDALNFWLTYLKQKQLTIPAASDIRSLKLEANQIATLITADTEATNAAGAAANQAN